MSFASLPFIFIFLPVVLVLYYVLPKGNWRQLALVGSSLAFFAWADAAHLPALIVLVLVNYAVGRLIDAFRDRDRKSAGRVVMWVGVVFNILVLIFFRYLGFFEDMWSAVTHHPLEWRRNIFFLGISYITFSSISYIADIYRNKLQPQKNLLDFSAYLIMFPKLVEGPIAIYKDFRGQLAGGRFDAAEFGSGIRRFIIGLAKKILLADTLAVAANKVFAAEPDQLGLGIAWFGLLCYSLVIYFDFSGYTDMALGVGRLFGFKLPENFDHPYISRSVAEFWRRWHMTLTNWFRTYVFMPLEHSRRRAKFRVQTHILIVFFLTGFWHGANWNFALWGLYFGILLAVEASGFGRRLKRAPVVFQHAYTILAVMLGWVLFGIRDIGRWGPFFKALFGANGLTGEFTLRSANILFYVPLALAGILLSLPVLSWLKKVEWFTPAVRRGLADLFLLAMFALAIAYNLANGFQPFLYAQF